MDKLRIQGGRRLRGSVPIGGAKNAALPALAACLLTAAPVRLRNVPRVRDVRTMTRVLEQLGAATSPHEDGALTVRVERLGSFEAPYDLVKTMRASVLVLGPLLARHGRARVSLPGGCAIGERPIDFHIEGLSRLGADVRLEHGYVEASAERLRGARYVFPRPSVTGTENLMMAATLAEGTTVLGNCAQEPEVVDLAQLLQAMGAEIRGAGGDEIVIEGRRELHGAEHAVIPDRIEAGTYLVAGVLVGDPLELTGCRPEHLEPVLQQLRAAGVSIDVEGERLRVAAPDRLLARDLRTSPHPGFPTDMQAQYMALMTQARGTAVISETVFERRYMHVGELARMGADIRLHGRACVVVGPTKLTGAQVMATDLRASAGLVLAALVAAGPTVIDRVYHLDRGYESMEQKLQAVGAAVERIR
ncbi:MAG TPA: UDP-N-acetylglucosamine 1-carboxyvinyltransferase [Candidatus Polarisedimenticolaceae bacterium]|nr:UDP-N-acetylglucosamine 1-carboxyvinyltransferase [Candidatus Polarisedimenticolaceae bacterium]